MKTKITRVCLVDTVYTLFVYLLYSTEEEINHTFFFFSSGVAECVRTKFENKYFFDPCKKWYQSPLLKLLYINISKLFRWRFVRKARIFGHDHLPYSAMLIGHRHYTYVEDAPFILNIYPKNSQYKSNYEFWNDKRHRFKKWLVSLFIGKVWRGAVGGNEQCDELILSVNGVSEYIPHGRITVCSLEEMWGKSTERKKKLILEVFDINNDLDSLKEKSIIILTGQWAADKIISEAEEVKIYKEIIDRYDISSIVIKPHPRSVIEFEKHFPGIYVLKHYIPMQLINLIGIRFKKAITIASSAIISLPDETEKEWLGTKIHQAIYRFAGDLKLEDFIPHAPDFHHRP